MQDQRQGRLVPHEREDSELLKILDRVTRKMGGKSRMIQFSNDHRPCIEAVSEQNSSARTVLRQLDTARKRLRIPPEMRSLMISLQIKPPFIEEQNSGEGSSPLNPASEAIIFPTTKAGNAALDMSALHEETLNALLAEYERSSDKVNSDSSQGMSVWGILGDEKALPEPGPVCSTGPHVEKSDLGERSDLYDDPSTLDVYEMDDLSWNGEDIENNLNDKMESDSWLKYLDEITTLQPTNGLPGWDNTCTATPSNLFISDQDISRQRQLHENCVNSQDLPPIVTDPANSLDERVESLERDIRTLQLSSKGHDTVLRQVKEELSKNLEYLESLTKWSKELFIKVNGIFATRPHVP